MTIDDERGRYAAKRDRLARLTRLVSILQAHPEGIRTGDIATRVGMSVRTVYRDLTALQDELRLPVWGEDGVWGIDSDKAFLPPLKLTQGEAMAVVLSAG
jgi:predicted DNA-binding transcriptional regulator YafY